MNRFLRIAIYVSFFAGFFLLVGTLVSVMRTPEQQILGMWRETAWAYEKPGKGTTASANMELSRELRDEITGELLIHTAETWEFLPDGQLILHKKNGERSFLHWKLKGRGHVLKVCLHGSENEYYDIGELNKNTLLLYIDTDVQAKGIVRLQFQRITN